MEPEIGNPQGGASILEATSTPQFGEAKSKRHVGLWLLFGVIFLAIGTGAGFLLGKRIYSHPSPLTSPAPSLAPEIPASSPTLPASPVSQKLQYSIPSTWNEYSKNFQKIDFEFFYPSEFSIFDGDEDSGNISLEKSNQYVLEIGRLSYFGVPEYTSGGRREWFIQSAQSVNPGLNITQDNYKFIPIDFSNGNSFYLVKENRPVNNQLPWPLSSDSDFYFGIFNNKSIVVIDHRQLPNTDVLRIMQSLRVN